MDGKMSSWDPSKRQLRAFSWIMALGLGISAWQLDWSGYAGGLRLAAGVVFAVGTVLPKLLRWPYLFLCVLLYPLIRFMNYALPSVGRFCQQKLLPFTSQRAPRLRARRRRPSTLY